MKTRLRFLIEVCKDIGICLFFSILISIAFASTCWVTDLFMERVSSMNEYLLRSFYCWIMSFSFLLFVDVIIPLVKSLITATKNKRD